MAIAHAETQTGTQAAGGTSTVSAAFSGAGGYYAIVYRQPARQGGRWSWRVDRGSELIASGWVDTLTQARAAVEAALDAVGA